MFQWKKLEEGKESKSLFPSILYKTAIFAGDIFMVAASYAIMRRRRIDSKKLTDNGLETHWTPAELCHLIWNGLELDQVLLDMDIDRDLYWPRGRFILW